MSRGIQRERAVRQSLEADGWWTIRAAGSHGCADIVAIRPGRVLFIEVKSDARNPFDHFGRERRRRLLDAATQAGAEAWLIWWPPRREQVWIEPAKWPTLGAAA